MTLQEALFLSSLNKAIYERGLPPSNTSHHFRCYQIQVELKQEEYQPIITYGTTGPYYRDAYEVTVARKEGDIVYLPHLTENNYTLEECIEYLHTWTIGEEFEHPWQPVETWEPKPITKQTDLAETILRWTKHNKEEIQEMSVDNIAKKLEIFLSDVENLCNEYVGDEQP